MKKNDPEECKNTPNPINNIAKNQPEQKNISEIGGVKGKEPTRYGDWQHKGRVTDF